MRYGAYAMEVLINELIKAGGRRERFEAKVFGGGAVLAGMTTMNIGDRNSEFVRRYLALEKIRIVAEDLQGAHPRKVAFMPRTGQVMVKKLRLQQEAGVAEREQALVRQTAEARAERLAAARKRVELFAAPAVGAARPKVELFGSTAAARPRVELFGSNAGNSGSAGGAGGAGNKHATGSATAGVAKSRVELFGSSANPRPANPNNARTAEEA
jgi:chemotaxis protein CheD